LQAVASAFGSHCSHSQWLYWPGEWYIVAYKFTFVAWFSQKKDKGALADADNEDLRLKAQKVR
jgi:hypothetical protein